MVKDMKTRKKGVSLTVLAITVVVMIILSSTIVINVGDSIVEARKTTFASELSTIEDAVSFYYLENATIPGLEHAITKEEIFSRIGEKEQEYLQEEFTLNGDDVQSTEFYLLDLSELAIENPSNGNLENGENDVYILSYPNLRVYYLAGISADGIQYFSLTKLTDVSYLKEEKIEEEIWVTKSSGILVQKEVKTWTNEANITVQVSMEENEKLYLSFKDSTLREVATSIGFQKFSFQSFKDLVDKTSSLKVNLDQGDLEKFEKLDLTEKYITLIKMDGEEKKAEVTIDLSNVETTAPNVVDISTYYNEKENFVSFYAQDMGSGISGVYYEYLESLDDTNQVKYHYPGVERLDSDFIQMIGKKLEKNDTNRYVISMPPEVTKVQVEVKDHAGNVTSQIVELKRKVNVAISNVQKQESTIRFDIRLNSEQNIQEMKLLLSTDGINFDHEKVIQNIESTSFEQVIDYEDILFSSIVPTFLKVEVTFEDGTVESRICQLEK